MTISFNGVELTTDYGYLLNRTEGFSSPPIRSSEDVLTNRDGGNIYSRKWDMRTIALEGRVFGSSASDYFEKRRTLTTAFNLTEGTLSVTNWAGDSYQITAKVVQAPYIVEQAGMVTFADFRIVLRCEVPFFLGAEQSYSASLASGGGFPVSAPLPMPLGSQSGNRMDINNEGGVASYADFTVTVSGDVTDATLTNLANDKSFTINTTITAGDYVQIYRNASGLYVLKNGVVDWTTFLIGDFFEIEQGINTIVYTASSGTGGVTASFQNPYLTI